MKTSKSGRLGKLISVGTKMVGQSILNTLAAKTKLETRIQQAKLLTETLAELKGASMKFGQMLSIQGEHLLPPEIIEILSKLQDSAPSFSGEEMWKIVKNELGEKSNRLHFDSTSLAAASIGQVHRVELPENIKAVMKIQYPGISLAVNSEVALLKKVLSLVSKVYVGELEVDPLIEEIRGLLVQELDYEREGQFLQFFHSEIEREVRLRDHFIVPQYFPEYSSKKILCMSEESGIPFKKYIDSSKETQEMQMIGRHLFELYLMEVYRFHTVQTDPNFGNYLIQKSSGQTKVVLLDFGATKTYPPEMIKTYKKFIEALLRKDRSVSLEIANEMNFLSLDETIEVQDLFYRMCLLGLEPVIGDGPFDFAKSDLPKRINDAGIQFLKRVRKTSPPRDIIFLNRKIGGIYNILRSLRVTENLRPLLDEYLQ